jgi:hypothetical protein
MSKKVLVIYYSQSGQLGDIINNFTQPLSEAGHMVEKVCIQPETPYPFPWTGKSFFCGNARLCIAGANQVATVRVERKLL